MSESTKKWFEFQSELATLHGNALKSQVDIFKKMRKRCITELPKMIEYLRKVDSMNPAFCGVSLLRVLSGTGLRETAHTRILAWIFDPNKNNEHKLGKRIFIDSFLSWIRSHPGKPKINFPPGDYSVKNVIPERHTGTDRKGRVDLWIDGTAKVDGIDRVWLVIIEAKVEADLSKHQLDDYQRTAKDWQKSHKNALEPCFVYLSDGSEADRKNWIPLAFETLTELIWTAVKPDPGKTETLTDGIHLIRLYLAGVLSDVVRWDIPIEMPVGDSMNY